MNMGMIVPPCVGLPFRVLQNRDSFHKEVVEKCADRECGGIHRWWMPP